MKKAFIPLLIFVVLLGFLAVGLSLNPREIPSPLINKPAPAGQLTVARARQVTIDGWVRPKKVKQPG